MTVKQKQKIGKKKKGGEKKQKQTRKDIKKTPAKAQSKKKVARSIPVKATIQKKRQPLHTHFDPLAIGFTIFIFGILFTLMMSFAVALGFGGDTQKKVTTVVDEVVNVINFDEFIPDEDGKLEALNGVKYDPEDMFYPIAVMFDNHSLARPQSHLQNASLVYETLVEGSITRFMGIFDHGNLDKIGPVRSSRPYFVQWADALDAAYVHAGGSPEALQKIREYSVKDIVQGQFFYRDYSRVGPHNLYTDSVLLKRALRDYGWEHAEQNFSRWEFDDDPDKGTLSDGDKISLAYSGGAIGSLVRWEYSPETENYKRFQAGVSHEDTSTGAQFTTQTVIVQIIPPIVSIGDKGRLTLDIMGEGVAHIVFNGKRIKGIWKKPSITSRTTFYDQNGDEVVFPRGKIFVNVIPSDREVTFE